MTMFLFIYVLGWLAAYPVVMREVIRNHRREFPSLEWTRGATFFTLTWSLVASMFWPLILIGIGVWSLCGPLHDKLKRYHDGVIR